MSTNDKESTIPSPSPVVTPTAPSKFWKHAKTALGHVLDQWFLIALGIVVAIASQVQVAESQQHTKSTVVSYLCVCVVFLLTGLTLSTRALFTNYKRIGLHLYVQGFCFLIDSASVFAVMTLFGTNHHLMDPGLLVGFVFMGCVPTTISSNVVMTRSAHGNEAVTVVESTIGNVLAPFISPLLIRMYLLSGAWWTQSLDQFTSGSLTALYRRVFKQLGLSMLIPLFVGQVIQNLFPKITKKIMTEYKVGKLSSLALLVIVWSAYDAAFATGAFDTIPSSNSIIVVFISIAFYIVWLALGVSTARLLFKFNKRDTVSIAYCVPAKTPAMGVPLATSMFVGLDASTRAKLQIPLVIFQGLQIAMGSLLVPAFRNWVRDEEEREKALLEGKNTGKERESGNV
ncbi:hypothetical protein CYLTODRAFT_374517 [Cylindrobasidium torrendii FP15055 ss-10]|uniref:Sodium bile acid symporter family protein n=1 Tax=Cylindrobasidium torrendii FP15055 ss-10 TaxID=1314674 RepID=A0A0D7BDX8_9AGAR|nr:hypothetical protein CYLTODRAFT_374517 [Cylindrobasidium torrendii FP15055 ss-10]